MILTRLTFDEIIENHRKMWNWIADETIKRKEIVYDFDYFDENNIKNTYLYSYCCHYAYDNSEIFKYNLDKEFVKKKDCKLCPIDWGNEYYSFKSACFGNNTAQDLLLDAKEKKDWQLYASYAREIANLPIRLEAIK